MYELSTCVEYKDKSQQFGKNSAMQNLKGFCMGLCKMYTV